MAYARCVGNRADFACFAYGRPGGYICSAILRATNTPLADAWDREWVTPLQSPMT